MSLMTFSGVFEGAFITLIYQATKRETYLSITYARASTVT